MKLIRAPHDLIDKLRDASKSRVRARSNGRREPLMSSLSRRQIREVATIMHVINGMLLVGALYLLETIEWHRSWGFNMYVLPFGFVCEWWMARDLAYLMIIVAFCSAYLIRCR